MKSKTNLRNIEIVDNRIIRKPAASLLNAFREAYAYILLQNKEFILDFYGLQHEEHNEKVSPYKILKSVM